MPGLIINGKEVLVPGLDIKNWNDNPALRRSPEDGRLRKTKWIKQVIIHTTKGIPGGKDNRPQYIIPGAGPDLGKDIDVAKFWSASPIQSGAHIIIDVDGSIGCIADLSTETMYHAGNMNESSIGIEIYQMSDAGIYQASLTSCVILCNALSEIFGIQRQVHLPYLLGPVTRLENAGKDCVGFFGHRDCTNNRGRGDPGDFIMSQLIGAGYERFNFAKGEDLEVWKLRQKELNISADGIPGPGTTKALKDAGFINGLWVLGKKNPVVVLEPPSNLPEPPNNDNLSADEMSFIRKIIEFFKKLWS